MALQSTPEVGNFYDGGLPARDGKPEVPPRRDQPPSIVLERRDDRAFEEFALQRRIAYEDSQFGELLVPAALDSFRTDLTSVPTLLTWLVPKSGAHLPAALLHDGLVYRPPAYTSTKGHVIDRIDADRVFRDAMRDTKVGVVRRWLAWAGVSTLSLFKGGRMAWSSATVWRWRATILGTVGLILYLGFAATFDLFDDKVPGFWQLPWMGDRAWWVEILGGLSGAIVVPLLLGLVWGRYRNVAFIGGLAIATLMHVMIVVGLVAAGYWGAETLAKRSPGLATTVALVVVLLAVGLFVPLLIQGW